MISNALVRLIRAALPLPALAALAMSLFALPGCAVPTRELTAYREASSRASTLTEDWWVRVRVDVRSLAAGPLGPEERISSRMAESAAREADIDARLKALEIWKRYDSALLALAEGRPVESIEADLNGIIETLYSFKIDRLATVTPYVGIFVETTRLIEDAVRAKRFRDAVRAADPAIEVIEKILAQDAISTSEFSKQVRELELHSLRLKAMEMLDIVEDVRKTESGAALIQRDDRRGRVARACKALGLEFMLEPLAEQGTAQTSTAGRPEPLVDVAVARLEEFGERAEAFGEVTETEASAARAYVRMLGAWRASHHALKEESGRISIAAAREVIESAMALKQELVAVQQSSLRTR